MIRRMEQLSYEERLKELGVVQPGEGSRETKQLLSTCVEPTRNLERDFLV